MKMIDWDSMTVSDCKAREKIDESKQIRLVRLSHMRYQQPHFTEISIFLGKLGDALREENGASYLVWRIWCRTLCS